MRKYVPIVRAADSPRGYERALSNGRESVRKGERCHEIRREKSREGGRESGRERGGEGGKLVNGDVFKEGQRTPLRPLSSVISGNARDQFHSKIKGLGSEGRGSRVEDEVHVRTIMTFCSYVLCVTWSCAEVICDVSCVHCAALYFMPNLKLHRIVFTSTVLCRLALHFIMICRVALY